MKINWGVIKFFALSALIVLLFSFGKVRNDNRKLNTIDIEFVDLNPPFITLNTVNKLLIQNEDSVTSIRKETLVLREMESRLLENPMIRDAEVFVTVDGRLGAKIEQRRPIARVAGVSNYYLDEDGKSMPLSSVYTARVPLLTGSSKSNFTELTPLLLKINEDSFMKSSVVGLHLGNDGNVLIRLRNNNLKVLFGKPENLEQKFQNLKAFYHRTKQDNTLSIYSLVNLEFGNQVVATKK